MLAARLDPPEQTPLCLTPRLNGLLLLVPPRLH